MTSLQKYFYTAVSKPSFKEKQTNKGLVINPLWLTGFIDGEGCFHNSIYKNKNKVGWAVKPEFQISLHFRDKALLEKIQNYFQVGNLFISSKRDICTFRIQSPKDLKRIINHLDLYPLKTQKLSDYIIFKEVFNLILNKQHLTISGLKKIVEKKFISFCSCLRHICYQKKTKCVPETFFWNSLCL